MDNLAMITLLSPLSTPELERLSEVTYRSTNRLIDASEVILHKMDTEPAWSPAYREASTRLDILAAAMREQAEIHAEILTELARRSAIAGRAAEFLAEDAAEFALIREMEGMA